MKARFAAAMAVAATSVYAAQVSYTTVTVDNCPTESAETMITVTAGVTVTYCPDCHMTPGGGHGHPGYTTVYTTTYKSLCPTGIVDKTYTITESCTEPEPTWTPGPKHIPQGFTVTTQVCHVCDKTPQTHTMTYPCGCEAHEGTPGPPPSHPKPTSPAGGSPPPNHPAPGGSPPSYPAPSPPACNGEDCGGSSHGSSPPACDGEHCGGSSTGSTPPKGHPAPPESECSELEDGQPQCSKVPPKAPYPTTTKGCSGPECRAKETGSAPSGVDYGNTTGIVPSEGSAASSFAFISSSFFAIVVGALAFAL